VTFVSGGQGRLGSLPALQVRPPGSETFTRKCPICPGQDYSDVTI
jgi:hypothetical protein